MGDPGCSAEQFMQEDRNSSTKMDWQQMLEHAKSFKQEGNELYKQKEHKKAVGKYHRGLLYIRGIHSNQTQLPFLPADMQPRNRLPSAQGLAEIAGLGVDLHNNLAACLLQMEPPRYDKICQYCEKVLEEQPNNPKAIYRQAVALYHLKNTARALTLLQRLHELGHNDSNTMRYLRLCEQEEIKQDENLKQTYKGMFSKMAEQNLNGDVLSQKEAIKT